VPVVVDVVVDVDDEEKEKVKGDVAALVVARSMASRLGGVKSPRKHHQRKWWRRRRAVLCGLDNEELEEVVVVMAAAAALDPSLVGGRGNQDPMVVAVDPVFPVQVQCSYGPKRSVSAGRQSSLRWSAAARSNIIVHRRLRLLGSFSGPSSSVLWGVVHKNAILRNRK
jgi:hypothetical protein